MTDLTLKQEHFCQAYIETGNASEAYRQAYNAKNMKQETIWKRSGELLSSGAVSGRVNELQAEHRERHSITIDGLTLELEKARLLAMSDEKGASAAVSAVMGKAKLHGLLKEKAEISGPNGSPIKTQDINRWELGRQIAFALRTAAEEGPGEDAQDVN